ncbi:MAG: hypothetical protein ACLULM_01500 [Acutalibacter sp.]
MITGDHAATALPSPSAWAWRAPLQVLTGQELDRLDEALAQRVAQYRVFAGSPRPGGVKAFQRQGRWWP